ncbi:LysE family translocator [Rhizobium sp. XQZ8]|uniref:LysE family translocator n=1 Tax=Rhizobium populisoli TaxID=2859785 RepID=UPI001C66CFE9|nr:LysE family translocator [Rhizobium populisoli]MBW6424094.1 LysE family translocator [Rhizobium populisoli]
MAELWIFLGALTVAYLLPGPDMVLVLQVGTARGTTHAMAAAAGLAASRGVHVALAALGLAALLRTSPLAFDIVKLVGSLYLVWLGIGILRAASLLPEHSVATEHRSASYKGDIGRGLLTNFLNPKPLLFCSVLLPQFIHTAEGGVAGQFLFLGIVLVSVGFAFDATLSFVGSALGQFLRRHPLVQTVQKWIFASLLIGFGARLALSARPQ